MVSHLKTAGIANAEVLWAIANTERHLLLDSDTAPRAYDDTALPIGSQQTISQPLVVARMSELLLDGIEHLRGKRATALEVGTGSGYQALVLSHLFDKVFSIERISSLHARAAARLATIPYSKVELMFGDGILGWPAHSPYDAIIITAATAAISPHLFDQLADPGVMVAPLGEPSRFGYQRLTLWLKQRGKISSASFDTVVFVPLLKGTN